MFVWFIIERLKVVNIMFRLVIVGFFEEIILSGSNGFFIFFF